MLLFVAISQGIYFSNNYSLSWISFYLILIHSGIHPRIDPEIPDLPGPNLNYPDPDPGFIFPEKSISYLCQPPGYYG